MNQAIVLFGHGSRDEKWKEPFVRIKELIGEISKVRVELAYLEITPPQLDEVIDSLVSQGFGQVTVIPVFLGQGGHVRKDFPAFLEACRAKHPHLSLRTKPAVGDDLGVLQAIAKYCAHE